MSNQTTTADDDDLVACLRQRIEALEVSLKTAEAALSDIGDADREEGDDLEWCEKRAAKDLPEIRRVLNEKKATTNTQNILRIKLPVRRRHSDGCLLVDWRFLKYESAPRDLGEATGPSTIVAYVWADIPVMADPLQICGDVEIA